MLLEYRNIIIVYVFVVFFLFMFLLLLFQEQIESSVLLMDHVFSFPFISSAVGRP